MKRWVWWAAACCVAAVFGSGAVLAAVQARRAWKQSHRSFEPEWVPFVAPSALPGHEPLTLKTVSGRRVAASFVPSKNGVAVLLGHGTGAARAQLWGDAQLLVEAGYGVLLLDWPGCGESEVGPMLGRAEREAFTACVDFLAGRSDVQRIGAFGYSYGGGLMSAFVADEPRVKSLLAVNAWSDAIEQTRYQYRRWGPVRQLPAVAAAKQHIEGGNLVPADAAPRLVGRKTLFIAGLDDDTVPAEMSAVLAKAAGSQPRFIEGGGHTDFRERLPDWKTTLVGFFAE